MSSQAVSPAPSASRADTNRANAQHSTGPKTATGKAISSRNAATHGLTSSRVVLRNDEERDAFAAFEAALAKEILPATGSTLQAFHFDRLVAAAWNMDRCDRVHAELISASLADPLLNAELSKTIHNIELYRRRAERSYLMAAKQIRELQAETLFRNFIIGPEANDPETFGIGILTPLKQTREQYADDEANTNRRNEEQRKRFDSEARSQFTESLLNSLGDDDDEEDERPIGDPDDEEGYDDEDDEDDDEEPLQVSG